MKLNNLNEGIILNKICHYYNGRYKIKEGVTYIEIKNKEFEAVTNFTCSRTGTIVVLNNCKFYDLRLSDCCYQLIDPIFYDKGSVIARYIEDLIIDISPANKQDIYLDIEYSKNFTLNGNNNYHGNIIIKNVENVLINDVKMNPEEPLAYVDIRNSRHNIDNKLKINNSNLTSSFMKGYYLELTDTTINSMNNIYVLYKKIQGKNYAFKTTGTIASIILGVENNVYHKKNTQEELIISDKILFDSNSNLVKATNMISFLESLKEKVIKINKEEAKKIEKKLMKKRIKSYPQLNQKDREN